MSSHKNTPLEILLADKPRERTFVEDTENWSFNRAQRRKNGVNSQSYMRTIGDRLHRIADQKRQQQKKLDELLSMSLSQQMLLFGDAYVKTQA